MTRIILDERTPKRLTISAAREHSAALIQKLFANTPKPIRPITEHLAAAQGKGVRTAVLLAAALDESEQVPRETILAATAIELFHMATLVHDDVIDDAASRRGIASIHAKFSKKEAIICGDYLFCVATSTVSTIYEPYKDFVMKFATAIERVCLGELRQYANNYNMNMNLQEYLRIIHGKTAALFFISAYAGALIGGADERQAKKIGRIGTFLGMIFQILDDCKDYMLDESQALKPTKTDIAQGVINLPMLMALAKEPALRIANPTDLLTVDRLVNDVYRLNGVNDAIVIVEKYAKKIHNTIATLGNAPKQAALQALLDSQIKVAESFKL
ncbi:MAG: polyprenyl synthetase family protein [Defluviitaleaceae bacterium]|nr:polyprenyl synthetase family protein [Defluviitaleaceae bacterium]